MLFTRLETATTAATPPLTINGHAPTSIKLLFIFFPRVGNTNLRLFRPGNQTSKTSGDLAG
jgi:hypothetical protein